jgi:hypothetical protein
MMSVTDELLRNAESYARGFDKGGLPMPPGKKVAVVACMDARLLPSRILGLNEGDAHVIRNAGGVITDDGIRSLSISQHLLGTEEIILARPVVLRPRGRRARFDQAHPGEPVHPPQGQRARLRLRGRNRSPARGEVAGATPLRASEDARADRQMPVADELHSIGRRGARFYCPPKGELLRAMSSVDFSHNRQQTRKDPQDRAMSLQTKANDREPVCGEIRSLVGPVGPIAGQSRTAKAVH